ncbi:MAG: hypothetical protein GXY33_01750 [Phycisphaerae bacterium]|nr:hypothetical protein [Phycisphaerae bacterium]
MMPPRETVQRNLDQTCPERIGLNFGGEGRLNDMWGCGVGGTHGSREKVWTEGQFEFHLDVWGNVWHRIIGMSQAGEIFKPALEDWSQLKDYQLPDLANPENFERCREVFTKEAGDHYRLGSLPGFPFSICRYLRKMEVYFQDLVLEREHIDELHDRVTELLEKMIVQFGKAGADGVFFCEDWGTQERLLVSPPMWREIYKPLFARLCGTAHQNGMHVLMHSCGYIWEIIDDLAEVGVNALQFDQPALYGLERLAGKLKGLKVCLYSPVDIQRVLPTGRKTDIVAEARRMVELFGGGGGGLIAKNYGDLHGIGVEDEWDQWAYEAFVQHKDLQ